MAKQIFYHNLKKGNKTEVEVFNKDIKPYIEKNELAYWSSEIFLNEYFKHFAFDEPYAKSFGTIAQGLVSSSWRQYIKEIVFKYTLNYLKKYKKLPEGAVTFDVNWKTKKPIWLIKSLRKKQIVTFPKIKEAALNNKFKYIHKSLSEEHIKQICLLQDAPYVKGEYQRMQGYI